MKVTNKMQLYRLIYFFCQLCMFRAMFSPIIRSTWLYLQYLAVFTQVAVGWCLGWVETAKQFQLIQVNSRQQPGWTLPDIVNTDTCSWWWAKTSHETCRADKEKRINLYCCRLLVTFIIVSRCPDSWTLILSGVQVRYQLFLYSCQISIILESSSAYFRKILEYHISCKWDQWEPSCSIRTDRRLET
jgi:hypothetical protein